MFLILLLFASAAFYIYMKWIYSFWSRNQVLGPTPSFLVGNIGPQLSFSKQWGCVVTDLYNQYVNEPYIGFYKVMRPAIVARDVDLVKDILSKDFDCFEESDVNVSRKYDPLMAANPFFLKGDEWKEARKTIVPAFTLSKLKSLFPVMNRTGEEFVSYIKNSDTEFNAKELAVRFTTQNVIKCSFSIDPKCFDNANESEFLLMGREMFEPSFWIGMKFMSSFLLPDFITNYLPIPFVNPKIDKFFRHLVDTNKMSRTNGVQSTDVIQTLIQVQEKYDLKSETFLAGHALALFVDGTETSSIALSYAMYELACNADVQKKLYDNIVDKLGLDERKWNADTLQDMIYLEAVFHESLRLHPPILFTTRKCTKKYTLPKNKRQSEGLSIEPGTIVNIPILGIHMNPEYYSEPEKFIPDRFLPEEQRIRHKGTYLSFGDGPKNCLGIKFAISQLKVALAYVVKNFHIKLSPNHKPIVIDPQTILNLPMHGILLQFETR